MMAKKITLARFLVMVEDFGAMSTGSFVKKYPDCGSHEGYAYIQRKARELARANIPALGDAA